MDDYALVLNAGSSSLKFCVFRRPVAEKWLVESRGQIEGIGTSPRLLAKGTEGKVLAANDLSRDVRDGRAAIGALASWLRSNYGRARVLGVGHRVVHGGTAYAQPKIVTPKVLADLYELVPFAPLHQPHNLAAIQELFDHLPDVPQVACFDTGFHVGRPHIARVIPLPMSIRKTGLQRYGFHGLSYEYVTSTLAEIAPEIATRRTIIAHLGSGASLCAVDGGKSVDTSMSFTALDGLCMATRPGSIDPGAVLYLFQTLGMTVKEVETILYKKSGLLGISGISSDMRELLSSNAPEACLAVDYFVYRITKEIGALTAILGGIDALVFTAGIGENSPEIRRRICEASSWLGIDIDDGANGRRETRISRADSRVSAWVVP